MKESQRIEIDQHLRNAMQALACDCFADAGEQMCQALACLALYHPTEETPADWLTPEQAARCERVSTIYKGKLASIILAMELEAVLGVPAAK